MSSTTKMGLISCFVKMSVIILSITAPLSAHTLPTESISPRAVTPEEQSGLTYHFEFQNEQGTALSKEDAAGIKVFHYNHHYHANNSAGTSHLQKRRGGDRLIDETHCDHEGDQYIESNCLSNKDWQLKCYAGVYPGPYGPYLKHGTCHGQEICIDGVDKGYLTFAHCVSLENFVEIALTHTSGDNHKFHHRVSEKLPAGSVVTLRTADTKTNANIMIAQLEMSAQKCVRAIGNTDQCATQQEERCIGCSSEVLTLKTAGANRITFLARFGGPAITLYLHIYAKP